MSRGVSAGGGHSSLGYLFGSGESPRPARNDAQATSYNGHAGSKEPSSKLRSTQPLDVSKPAGIQSSAANNFFRADGQSTCNYITIVHQQRSTLPLEVGLHWGTSLVAEVIESHRYIV